MQSIIYCGVNEMKRILFTIVATLLVLFVNNALASGYSQDTGTISSMYTSNDGVIAITLSNGFANARSSNQCSTSNGWAGNVGMGNVLKAALISAKANDLSITVTIIGCEAGGNWFRIVDVYW